MGAPLPAPVVEQIRKLRYEECMTSTQVSAILGVNASTVLNHAPGVFGKVPNAPVRKVFEESGRSAASVAQEIGWTSVRCGVRGQGIRGGDSSRLLRTLGLRLEQHGRQKGYRQMIDAEVAMNIAEACGVAGWSVLPEDES